MVDDKDKEWRCNCAEFCKLPTGKKVSRSTYYAHAHLRRSLSPVPGGYRFGTPEFDLLQEPGQGPPIADILGGYPPLNLDQQREVIEYNSLSGTFIEYVSLGCSASSKP